MRFVGDIHGKFRQYEIFLDSDSPPSIQVGDFGRGFGETDEDMLPIFSKMEAGFHRYIRGNHDNPAKVKTDATYIHDGMRENGCMFIGGAYSIDKGFRTEGVDYWSDEECSWEEMDSFIKSYESNPPKIMVTHDCPESVARKLFNWYTEESSGSTTRNALQSMLDINSPSLWVFGHWHEARDTTINGTRFICLPELAYIDIDDSDLSKGHIVEYRNTKRFW